MKWRPGSLIALSFIPATVGLLGVMLSEPFPHGWLSASNPHYWPNLLRAATFMIGGVILALVSYTMLHSVTAETGVTGGHPRRRLYQHITLISLGHGLLVLTLMFYVRDRINQPLSPATPFAVAGLIVTVVALQRMLAYQNSRLRRFHSAKQIIGIIEAAEGDADLQITAVGSVEVVGLRDWIKEFEGGAMVRFTAEKVEETSDDTSVYRRKK